MAFDPRSYIRVLAVRHAIPREPGDHDGSQQARNALTAELNDLRQFAVRARALDTLVRTVTSYAEDAVRRSTAPNTETDQDLRDEASAESAREHPAQPYKPRGTGANSTGRRGSRRRRNRR